jgi:hypothetical protein
MFGHNILCLFTKEREALPPPRVSPEMLVARIRGEYREMPGLRLTFAQARRMWQMDADTCTVVLQTLVGEEFLIERQDGTFIALPTTATQLKTVKADLTSTRLRRDA